MNKDGDAALVEGCMNGDRRSMTRLMQVYEKPVYNVAYRILGNVDDAADVTQTVFLKAFQSIAGFNPQYRLFSWIYRIAINESLSHVKRRRGHEPLDDGQVSPWRSPEKILEQQHTHDRVQGALMKLGENYRTVVVLKHISGFSYQQVAEILSLPEKTVKSRLYSARQMMKKIMLDDGS